jgi:hypothetical protein
MRTGALHDYIPEEIQRVIEQSRTSAKSETAMDEEDVELLFDEEESQGKKGGKKSKRMRKRRSKRKSKRKSKKITKKSMKKKRNPVRKTKRIHRQYGGVKSPGLSAKLSALTLAVRANGSVVHNNLLFQLTVQESDGEARSILRQYINNPVLAESSPESVPRYKLSFRAIDKHLFEDREIEFSPALGRYILSGEFIMPVNLSETRPELYCPIGFDIMRDPVINILGFTYERANIEEWYREHSTNPATNEPLPLTPEGQPNKRLIPNIGLKQTIDQIIGDRDLYAPPPP